jgi:hypothetical protein
VQRFTHNYVIGRQSVRKTVYPVGYKKGGKMNRNTRTTPAQHRNAHAAAAADRAAAALLAEEDAERRQAS